LLVFFRRLTLIPNSGGTNFDEGFGFGLCLILGFGVSVLVVPSVDSVDASVDALVPPVGVVLSSTKVE
jgi:hypothetical protein